RFAGQRASKRPDLLLMQDRDARCLLAEVKRPSHALTRDGELQAVRYRDDLSRYFPGTRFEILVIGGPISRDIDPHHASTDLKMLSFAQVVGRARNRMDWAVRELVRADDPEAASA